jgi:hypothetical protein
MLWNSWSYLSSRRAWFLFHLRQHIEGAARAFATFALQVHWLITCCGCGALEKASVCPHPALQSLRTSEIASRSPSVARRMPRTPQDCALIAATYIVVKCTNLLFARGTPSLKTLFEELQKIADERSARCAAISQAILSPLFLSSHTLGVRQSILCAGVVQLSNQPYNAGR